MQKGHLFLRYHLTTINSLSLSRTSNLSRYSSPIKDYLLLSRLVQLAAFFPINTRRRLRVDNEELLLAAVHFITLVSRIHRLSLLRRRSHLKQFLLISLSRHCRALSILL